MTAKEIQARNARAEGLRVLQADDKQQFFVESNEGKILYRVASQDGETLTCTCGDYATNVKRDPNHQCKHIAAVLSCQSNGGADSVSFLEKVRPKLDDRFIMRIEGKEFVKYPGLLDLGHQKGISRIEVEPIQLPSKENGNMAICRATVISKTGETYIDIGDASPENVNSRIAKHLLRMASTRSIARALRSYTNIGMTCLEELESLDDIMGGGNGNSNMQTAPKRTPAKKSSNSNAKAKEPKPATDTRPTTQENHPLARQEPSQPVNTQSNQDDQEVSPRMSEAQKRAVHNLARRRGISIDDLEAMSVNTFGVTLDHLNARDAGVFIRDLQSAA